MNYYQSSWSTYSGNRAVTYHANDQYPIISVYGNQKDELDYSRDYEENDDGRPKSKVVVPYRTINKNRYRQQNHHNYNNHCDRYYRPNNNYGNRYSHQPYGQRKYHNNYSGARPPVKCFTCGETFKNHSEMHAHRSEAHSKRNFYCPVCNKQFGIFKNMKEHEKTHTIQACQECPEVFKFKESLLSHMEQAHPPPPPTVEEPVNKSGFRNFASPVAASTPAVSFSSSTQDSGVHVKMEHAHACDLCIKSFDSEEKLKSHIKIHTDFQPQSESQSESESQYQSLAEPQSSDKLSCPFCIKQFSSRRELTLHLESAHTRVFYCRKCPAEYSSQIELDAHSKVHA
uniref:Zinc finger protein 112 n=1 Tax=Lygus hesperus TaxID=30085 RepID=A0A146LU66_LYGHE